MTQATISQGRFHGEPEIIKSIEIGHVLHHIKQLSDMAKLINERPDEFCEAATLMAYVIADIERAVNWD